MDDHLLDSDPSRHRRRTGSSRPSSQSRVSRPTKLGSDSRTRNECTKTLTQALYRLLDNGQLDRARRVFAALIRLQGRSDHIDLRRGHLWAVGLELLGHDERSGAGRGIGGVGTASAAAAPRLQMAGHRTLLEFLIRRHPYDHLHPRALSAPDFLAVSFGCEVHKIQSEYQAAVRDLADDDDYNDEAAGTSESGRYDTPPGGHETGMAGRHHPDAEVAGRALHSIQNLASRMDQLLQEEPYSKHQSLLSLRGMLSLWIADLLSSATSDLHADHENTIEMEMTRSRTLFLKVMRSGGVVHSSIRQRLGLDELKPDAG